MIRAKSNASAEILLAGFEVTATGRFCSDRRGLSGHDRVVRLVDAIPRVDQDAGRQSTRNGSQRLATVDPGWRIGRPVDANDLPHQKGVEGSGFANGHSRRSPAGGLVEWCAFHRLRMESRQTRSARHHSPMVRVRARSQQLARLRRLPRLRGVASRFARHPLSQFLIASPQNRRASCPFEARVKANSEVHNIGLLPSAFAGRSFVSAELVRGSGLV